MARLKPCLSRDQSGRLFSRGGTVFRVITVERGLGSGERGNFPRNCPAPRLEALGPGPDRGNCPRSPG